MEDDWENFAEENFEKKAEKKGDWEEEEEEWETAGNTQPSKGKEEEEEEEWETAGNAQPSKGNKEEEEEWETAGNVQPSKGDEEEEEEWEKAVKEVEWEKQNLEEKKGEPLATGKSWVGGKAEKKEGNEEEDWDVNDHWVPPVIIATTGKFEETDENWDTPSSWEVPKTAPRNEDKTRGEPKVKKPKKLKNDPQQKVELAQEYTAEEKLKMKQEAEAKSREADLLFAKDLFAGLEDDKFAKKEKENNAKATELLTTLDPKDEREFQELAKTLGKRIEGIEEVRKGTEDSKFQLNVVKEVFKTVLSSLDPDDIIEIVKVITVQLNEKTKNKAAKTATKGKAKVNLPTKKDIEVKSKDAFGSLEGPNYEDDDYDFM